MISTSLTTIITKPAAAKGPFQRSVWDYNLVRMSMMPDVIVLNPDLVAHLTTGRKSSYLPFYDGTVSRPSSGVVA